MCQSIDPGLNRNLPNGTLAGCTLADTDQLMNAPRSQVLPLEAEWIDNTEYGTKYRIRATLAGPNGGRLGVVSIWMNEEATGVSKFDTLFPDKS